MRPTLRKTVHRSLLLSSLLAALALAPSPPAGAEPAADAPSRRGRVVIFGVDGLSWNLVDPMLERGELPSLARLQARGVHARLETVEPVISPTVWTSIATGRGTEAHGVTNFFASSLDVRVPTAFERLAARGVRVGLYDWLVGWPPPRFDGGFAIPGWTRRDARTWPDDVFARAGVAPYFWDVEKLRRPEQFAAAAAAEVAEKPGRFLALLRAFDPAVATVTFYCIDASSHRFYAAAYPGEFENGQGRAPDPRFGHVVPDALRGVDRALGIVLDALAPEDSVIVVSDHGFRADPSGPRRVWVAHTDAWQARAGLDPQRDGFTLAGFGFVVARVLPGPFEEREAVLARLESLLHAARTKDGEGLYATYALDAEDRPPGRGLSLRRRAEALALRAYLWWLGVRLDQPAHAWLVGVSRDDALERALQDRTVLFGDAEVPLDELLHVDDFTGTHDPVGVFLAAGPAVRHEERRLDVSVLDVAPLVFAAAGEPAPDDLDRALRTDLLDPAWLAAHPVRREPAATWPAFAREFAPPGADSDEALQERLEALGYVR